VRRALGVAATGGAGHVRGASARAAAGHVAAWGTGLRPRTILVAGWLLFLLYAYPGYMSSDSIDQLLDSRVRTFNDWHSPTMTEVWRLIGFAIAGPFGMLALQSLLLLLGTYVLVSRTLRARVAAVVACGLLVLPPVMATMAVIWRDSQMAGFLIAGLAAVTSRRRGLQLCGLGLLVLASAMRESAAFAVLPILVIGLAWGSDRSAWRRYAIAVVAWLVVWLCAVELDVGLRSAATRHMRLELATTDLPGVLRYAGPIDDAEVRELFDGVPLRGIGLQSRARSYYTHPGEIMNGSGRLFDPPANADDRDAIVAVQPRLALAYPGAYLTHRWHVLYRVLALGRMSGWDPIYIGFAGSIGQSEAAVHTARHSAVQRGVNAFVRATSRTPLFWPYVYAIIAIVLLPLAVRRRQLLPAILLTSGLLYELTLLVVAVSAEYALSHWLVTATSLACALMAIESVRTHRARVAVRA
jgi:hypothetical protein